MLRVPKALPSAILLAMAAACGGQPDGKQPAAFHMPQVPASQIVARVNGVPILAADLAFQLQGGGDRQTALRALIQAELLAQEAARRGLAQHPDVERARRRALAHALVLDTYGKRFTPADIPRELVERSYELNKIRFMHPAMASVAHVLALSPKTATPEQQQQARALAEQVRQAALALDASDEAAFKALAAQLQHKAPAITLRAESLTTPLRGFTVAEFADAAFALTRPGQVSPVVKTSFGYHVIFLKERLPEENRPLAEVEGEIRQRIFEEARRELVVKWLDELERQQGVTVNQQLLEQALAPSPAS